MPAPDDLSGREVFVRRSSSYFESLTRLNESLKGRGKPPVVIKEAPEALEDDDILEMVNAGLVEMTVVDDFMVEFWQQVFPDIKPLKNVAVRTGGEIAVGVRKNNPKLLARGQRVDQGIWDAQRVRQHHGAPVPQGCELRQERGGR